MHLNEHAAGNVTIDASHAMQLHLKPRCNEVSRSVIIWRGSRADFRLVGASGGGMYGLGLEVILLGRSR